MSFVAALTWFGLLSVVLVGIEISMTYATKGFLYGFSANRPPVEHSALAKRMKNAFQNHVESASYIVPILGAGALTGLSGAGVELAALLIVVGRALFAPLYWTGLSFVRVPAFLLTNLACLYVVYLLLTQAL